MGRILVREVLGLAVSVLVLVIDKGRSNFLSPWSISSRFFSKKNLRVLRRALNTGLNGDGQLCANLEGKYH